MLKIVKSENGNGNSLLRLCGCYKFRWEYFFNWKIYLDISIIKTI